MTPNRSVNLGEPVIFNTLVVFGDVARVGVWCESDKPETLARVLERAKQDPALKGRQDEIRDMVPISLQYEPNQLILGLPETTPQRPPTPRAQLEALRAAS